MDSVEAENKADFFLRPAANAKIGQTAEVPKKTVAKQEVLVLKLQDETEAMVMDTLRYIHGNDFELSDIAQYDDKGASFCSKYFTEKDNLMVKSAIDFSKQKDEPEKEEERLKMFALMRLESYGFHKNHCQQAMEICNDDMQEALYLLYQRYFKLETQNNINPHNYTENELLEMKNDEKESLKSIFEGSFYEKDKDSVWILDKLKLDYLIKEFTTKKNKTVVNENLKKAPKKQKCRLFLQGNCKFGSKCRFSHEIVMELKNENEHLNKFNFELEVRFSKKSRYPCEPPMIFLKTNAVLPDLMTLHIGRRLLDEAKQMTNDSIPCIYSLVDLLNNEEEIVNFVKNTKMFFPRSTDKLIPEEKEEEINMAPSHYKKGTTSKDGKKKLTIEELQLEDNRLATKQNQKTNSDKYLKMQESRQKLPIFSMREEILKTIDQNQVVVISGETGCGKTTQVPQILLEEWLIYLNAKNSAKKNNNEQNTKTAKSVENSNLNLIKTDNSHENNSDNVVNNGFTSNSIEESSKTCSKIRGSDKEKNNNFSANSTNLNFFSSSLTFKKHVEIICTQPRRISAIRMAERVAEERIEKTGETVGYQIRLENKISNSTRLTFCTTGILLKRLEEDPFLNNITHIIIDEVHERSQESDFLLCLLKDLLQFRSDLKIILMSATLNSELFSVYFDEVPIVTVPGRTFPVDQMFLEDILDVSGYVLEPDSEYTRRINISEDDLQAQIENCDVTSAHSKPKDVIKDDSLSMPQVLGRYKGYSVQTCKNIFLMNPDRINNELIESILNWIVYGEHEYPRNGSILIFLPGIQEITSLYELLCVSKEFNPRSGRYMLLPLHSSLTSEEQAAIFIKPKDGVRKIILSTNLAETSLTINDCIFVIDSGKMKEKHFDSNRNMESLDTVWTTKANSNQRKGRAGRVTSGLCIHLFTKHRYLHHLHQQPVPEIKRIPLEKLLLNIRILRHFQNKEIFDVFDKLIEPPSKESIENAIIRLQNIGAFDKKCNLTPLGTHLASLPVDVRIGKLLIFGSIFGCVDNTLTIAASLSENNIFLSPFNAREQARNAKLKFKAGFSDHLTTLNAYKKFQIVNNESSTASFNFCKENYLSKKTLLAIADTKHQYLELLIAFGFVPIHVKRRPRSGQDLVLSLTGNEFNVNNDNNQLLCAILCSALYPNIIKILSKDVPVASGPLAGLPTHEMQPKLIFKTIDDTVAIHPSSVNYKASKFSSSFLIYQEKIKTSQIFVRDTTMVHAMPLLLFSGYDIDISVHNGLTYVLLNDKWIVFRAEHHRVAEMIKMIRLELVTLLDEKIKDPLLNILTSDKGKRIISTILNLIATSS